MDNQQFDRELKYQVSINIVRQMLEKGIISTESFEKWRQRLIEKSGQPQITRAKGSQENFCLANDIQTCYTVINN